MFVHIFDAAVLRLKKSIRRLFDKVWPATSSELRDLAGKGDAVAQYKLGVMYYHGDGVAVDYHAAAAWFRLSADQGDPDAQYNLGLLYYKGHGVSRDSSKAMEWCAKSANQGGVKAQYFMGDELCRSGDYSSALVWFELAAMNGNSNQTNAEE